MFLGSDHTDGALARVTKAAYSVITTEMLARLREPDTEAGDDLVCSWAGSCVTARTDRACGVLIGLVQGGFETTTSFISTAIFTLLRHPDEVTSSDGRRRDCQLPWWRSFDTRVRSSTSAGRPPLRSRWEGGR